MPKLSRLASIVVCSCVLFTHVAFAQPKDPANFRALVQKYHDALKAKGENVHAFNAKRIIKYISSHPVAARGMFMGYKSEWDKKLGWQATKADKSLAELQQRKRGAELMSTPMDNKAFDRYQTAWQRLLGDANYHIRQYCKTADKTCDAAKAMRKLAITKVVEGWKHGLTSKSITFDALQDRLLEGEREEDLKPHTRLDKWVPQLAAEKTAYWKKTLAAGGGHARLAKRKKGHVCVITRSAGGGKTKARDLRYIFRSGDKAHIRCQFNPAPSRFRRNKGKSDYWRVSVYWAGTWQNLTTDSVRRPSKRNLVKHQFDTRRIASELKRQMRTGSNKWPGTWLRVKLAYIVPYISGYKWVNGTRVPVWKFPEASGASFFLKWR